MPKLNPEQQQKAEDAKDQEFELLPEGRYLAKLSEVEQRPGNEGDYWNATFTDITDVNGKRWPGRQWDSIGLGPKSAWKQKQFFNAFGYSLDSDTDEMIGEVCVLHIGQEIQKRGKRAGETVNKINRLAPYEPDAWDGIEVGGAGSGADSDDSF